MKGIRYGCETCFDFSLCFKCEPSKSKIHPRHSFRAVGEEWEDKEEDAADEKSEVPPKISGDTDGDGIGNSEVKLDEENHSEEFDDEIVG